MTAAGRTFLELVGDHVRFAEGSYGQFLLKDDLTRERLTFGCGGRVRAMAGPGLGVRVLEDRVQRLAACALRIEFD